MASRTYRCPCGHAPKPLGLSCDMTEHAQAIRVFAQWQPRPDHTTIRITNTAGDNSTDLAASAPAKTRWGQADRLAPPCGNMLPAERGTYTARRHGPASGCAASARSRTGMDLVVRVSRILVEAWRGPCTGPQWQSALARDLGISDAGWAISCQRQKCLRVTNRCLHEFGCCATVNYIDKRNRRNEMATQQVNLYSPRISDIKRWADAARVAQL